MFTKFTEIKSNDIVVEGCSQWTQHLKYSHTGLRDVGHVHKVKNRIEECYSIHNVHRVKNKT